MMPILATLLSLPNEIHLRKLHHGKKKRKVFRPRFLVAGHHYTSSFPRFSLVIEIQSKDTVMEIRPDQT